MIYNDLRLSLLSFLQHDPLNIIQQVDERLSRSRGPRAGQKRAGDPRRTRIIQN